jgi:hypothetical protein
MSKKDIEVLTDALLFWVEVAVAIAVTVLSVTPTKRKDRKK